MKKFPPSWLKGQVTGWSAAMNFFSVPKPEKSHQHTLRRLRRPQRPEKRTIRANTYPQFYRSREKGLLDFRARQCISGTFSPKPTLQGGIATTFCQILKGQKTVSYIVVNFVVTFYIVFLAQPPDAVGDGPGLWMTSCMGVVVHG